MPQLVWLPMCRTQLQRQVFFAPQMFFTAATLDRHFCYSNVYDRKAEGRPASSPCRPCRLCGSLRAESDRPADGLLKQALEASWLVFVVIATFLGHTECFSAGPNVFSAPNVFYLFCPIRSLIRADTAKHSSALLARMISAWSSKLYADEEGIHDITDLSERKPCTVPVTLPS